MPTTVFGRRRWADMPKAVVRARLNDSLATVYDHAGVSLGIGPGPEALRSGFGGEGLASMLVHIGFYREADEAGFNVEEHFGWHSVVAVVDENGSTEYRDFREVTVRQVFASAQLGLIAGDVARPYICPSMPQGDLPGLAELAQVSADAAKAAYAGLQVAAHHAEGVRDAGRDYTDDAERVVFYVVAYRWLRGLLRRKSKARKKAQAVKRAPKPKTRKRKNRKRRG